MKRESHVPDLSPCGLKRFRRFRSLARAAAVAAPLAIAGPPVMAQDQPRPSTDCTPSLQVVDSLLNVVSAVVEVTDGHGRGPARVPLDYLNLVVEEIASRVQVPADVGGGVLMPMPYSALLGPQDTMHVAAPAVRASLAFTLQPDGSIVSVGLWGSALNTSLEDAVYSAILATDSAGGMPRFPADMEQRPLLLRIVVEPEEFWKEQPASALTTRSELRPLFSLARPLVRVTTLPVRGLGTAAERDDFRRAPARDTIRFVVSAEGRVLPTTVSVSRASYIEAGASELDWIMNTRFRPGRIGDCPVPMVVHIPMR